MGELCDLFTYPLPKPEACEYIWLFDFYELKVGMLAWVTLGFWLVGWELAWELDVWNKGCGYGIRDMNCVCVRSNSISLVGRSHGGV